jgi:hypothetical protein
MYRSRDPSLGHLSQAEVATLLLKLILDKLEALILRDGDWTLLRREPPDFGLAIRRKKRPPVLNLRGFFMECHLDLLMRSELTARRRLQQTR